jgi:hypothetical protein
VTGRAPRLFGLALLAALAVASVGAGAASAAPPTEQCKKIRGCVTVTGPWVSVPPSGEATFLLECPKRQGVVAGVDTLSSSKNVSVSWDAKPGTPIRAGTTTASWLFFRAVSTDSRAQVFQPFLGCIPPPKTGARSTLAARAVVKPANKLDRWMTFVKLRAGKTVTASRACGKKGEHLVGGWQAIAFDTLNVPPDPELAAKVHVELTVGDARVVASVRTAAGMPQSAFPEVQVGAVCAV